MLVETASDLEKLRLKKAGQKQFLNEETYTDIMFRNV